MTIVQDDRWSRIVERFSESMRFEFAERPSTGMRRRTGHAPGGKVGVIDVVDAAGLEVSFLYSGDPGGLHEQEWIDCCFIALADSTGIDFLPWLRSVSRRRCMQDSWVAQRRYPNGHVSLRFDPIDIMVLTIHRSTATLRLAH